MNVELPAATINDYPRFAYRGMMLDVSRHFFPVDSVKTYLDILALHNQNTFHWHLSDDQGWRIEIKKYPELTQIGSKRKETVIGHNSGTYDGKEYGGFYTQDQIRDVINYAAERHITIIPESICRDINWQPWLLTRNLDAPEALMTYGANGE